MNEATSNSPCVVQREDSQYECSNLGIVFREPIVLPIHCACGGVPAQPVKPIDAREWFSNRYAQIPATNKVPPLDGILAKLDRCRSAGCKDLQDDVCVRWRGSSCQRREIWFTRLVWNSCNRWPAMRYISEARLVTDCRVLADKLPKRIRGVVGVPRSGLLAASHVAVRLGVPLFTMTSDGPLELGHGWRLRRQPKPSDGPLVVIEDSVNSGASLQEAMKVAPSGSISACVYQNPLAQFPADMHTVTLPMPHFFEWHFYGSNLVSQAGFDIDGVIVNEETGGPLFLPRPHTVPLIVTGRPEIHRPGTEAWLREHRVTWDRLELYPGDTLASTEEIANFKAHYFVESTCRWFVESCPHQSRIIAEETGKPVICPTTSEVF